MPDHKHVPVLDDVFFAFQTQQAFLANSRIAVVIDERAVSRDASAAGISLRTGCFCNPGAGEAAFALSPRNLRGARRALSGGRGAHSVDDYLSIVGLPTGGAVRVSLGVASTLDDVDAFLDFAERTYRDSHPDLTGLPPRHSC